MKNTIKTLLVLILALVSVTMVAAADFSIDRVDVDGVTVSSRESGSTKAIYVERGTTVPVTVYMSGSPAGKTAYDARIQAYVGGYEYGKVEDVSDIFEVVPNVSYKKTLRLKMPEDMKATDKYTLNIEMFDDDQSTKRTYTLYVKEARHLVSLYDVIVNPVSNVQAGQPLFVTVRVENMGDNVEDSIKVTASMPKLGIEASEYVDQLVRDRDEDQDENRVTKRDAATTNELMLMIPENAQEGDYELSVKLSYNRGYGASNGAEDEKVLTVHVKSAKQTTGTATDSVLVNVDNTNQRVAVGEGVVYKVSMANLGKEAQTYSVEVLGVGSWGTSRVDPQNLIVPADKTGESLVYVSPAENAEAGVKTFTVKVKDSAGNVVSEKVLTLDVVGAQASGSYDAFKKVLEVGFIALLIILVVLGIVLVAKKLGGSNDSVEGQTYYQ